MAPEASERRLAAILSADVVGYSRLMAEDEHATIRTLNAYRDLIGSLVGDHHGRVVDATGDNLLAEFPNALDAVQCAVEIQGVLRVRNQSLSEGRRMLFRIGVHLGDITAEGNRLYGDGVNIAARLEGLAESGGICISGEVHSQVRSRLGLDFEDLSELAVKNIPEPVHVYRVRTEPAGPATTTSSPRIRRGLVAAGLVVALAAAGLAGWRMFPSGPNERIAAVDSAPIRSIAVLPLENISGDPEQEYFADGMTEALITALAKVEALRVISRTSVMQYKRARKPLPEIARELGVDAVVEGSVVRAGDRVRITAQLIHATTDEHLWAESYDRDLGDTLALQSEVARAIAEEVRVELTPQDERRLAQTGPVHLGAHEAVLRGNYFLRARGQFARGVAEFERAIELDPNHAPAYTGLARAYGVMSTLGMRRPREVMPLQKQAAQKAVELAPDLAEAQLALAAALHREWDWKGAETAYRRALELNPGSDMAAWQYSVLLIEVGRLDEALSRASRAQQLDPMSPDRSSWLGAVMDLAGEHEVGASLMRGAVDIARDPVGARIYLAMSHLRHGHPDDAVAVLRPAAELAYRNEPLLGFLGAALAEAGEVDEARALLVELLTRAREKYIEPNTVALIYAALGDDGAAFEWFERAYEEHSQMLIMVPALRGPTYPLRSDPRFVDLMRRVGLPG